MEIFFTQCTSDRLKQPINGLEKGIVSDFASQVLPETLYRVKLGRIGWQCHQLDLLRVSCKQGKNRFGKMDAIGINDNVGP